MSSVGETPSLVRANSHKLYSLSSSDSSSSLKPARVYEETPKALESLEETERSLEGRRVTPQKGGRVRKIAQKLFGRKSTGGAQETTRLEQRREAQLLLITNSLSVNAAASCVLFDSTAQETHLQLVDFSGMMHDITICRRLGEGADVIALQVDDLVGGSEREGVLLVEKSPIAVGGDFVEQAPQFSSTSLKEVAKGREFLQMLRGRGIDWIPKIHSVMVVKHPQLGFSKAELQEPLAPITAVPEKNKEQFAAKLALVVDKTHRCGVTHGDMKSDNIMARSTKPVLIDWDPRLSFERSKLPEMERGEFIATMEERRHGTPDYIQSDYTAQIDGLIKRAMAADNYELAGVKEDFWRLQKGKDSFGLACTLYEVVFSKKVPRTDGNVDREGVSEALARWRGSFDLRIHIATPLGVTLDQVHAKRFPPLQWEDAA